MRPNREHNFELHQVSVLHVLWVLWTSFSSWQCSSSVGEHATDGTCCQKLAGNAAEDPFAQSAMAIPAGHDQVRPLVSHKLKELGRNRPAWWAPDLVCDDNPVAHEIAGHVCQSFLGLRVLFMRRLRRVAPL
jgi:hypothetical protein